MTGTLAFVGCIGSFACGSPVESTDGSEGGAGVEASTSNVAASGTSTAATGASSTTSGDPVAGEIKFHPGTYVWYAPGSADGHSGYRIDMPTQRGQLLDFIDTLDGETAIRGVQVAVQWRALEGDTPGDYTAGFAAIDEIVERLSSHGQRLMLAFGSVVFGGYGALDEIFPAYIVDDPTYGITAFHPPHEGASARTWQGATNDRVIALVQAYGARYDGNPNVEMVGFGETALGVEGGDDGFSNQAVLAQLQRLYPAARSAWPHTSVRLGANDLAPDPLMDSLFDTAVANQVAVGGPDVWPLDITQADRVFVGLDDAHESIYDDRRGTIPWVYEVQWQSFGGQFTLQQLYDAPMLGYTGVTGSSAGFALPSMQPSYGVWYVNEVNGDASTQWATGILPFLRSVNGEVYPRGDLSRVPCPSSYAACKRD